MHFLFNLLFLSLALTYLFHITSPSNPLCTISPHIYEYVHKDFLIDAVIEPFQGNGPVNIYMAMPKRLTQPQICEMLIVNGDSVSKWTSLYDSDRYWGYTANTTLNGFLGHTVSKTRMCPGSINYSNSFSSRWSNSYIYFGQQHYDDNSLYTFADLFVKPRDFDFATAKEAESRVLEQLSAIGIVNLSLHRTLYIDYEILAKQVTPALQADAWQESGCSVSYTDWSKADNGYIFEFLMYVDGIPIFYRDIPGNTDVCTGGTVQVWYQSSGIVYLYAPAALWDLCAPYKSISRIISASVALTIARTKLESTKIYGNIVVDKISGEYIYVPNVDHFLLSPVWVVYAKIESTLTGITTRKCIVIDAVTGNILV